MARPAAQVTGACAAGDPPEKRPAAHRSEIATDRAPGFAQPRGRPMPSTSAPGAGRRRSLPPAGPVAPPPAPRLRARHPPVLPG